MRNLLAIDTLDREELTQRQRLILVFFAGLTSTVLLFTTSTGGEWEHSRESFGRSSSQSNGHRDDDHQGLRIDSPQATHS